IAALKAARPVIHERWPVFDDRRRAIGAALAEGGAADPLGGGSVEGWLGATSDAPEPRTLRVTLTSTDPEDLTLRTARALGIADRIYHAVDVPIAILERARADAERIAGDAPADMLPGLSVVLEM